MRLLAIFAAALWLAGCGSIPVGGPQAGVTARPKSVVVTDFVFAPEVVALDRSYTARLERKVGSFPTHERKQRTLERVNDEIVAAIVVTLREAGLEAEPGSEEGLSLSDDAVLINGKLHAVDASGAKANQIGFGAGRSGVVGEVTLSHLFGGGKRALTTIAAESGRKAAASSAARNTAIASVIASTGSPTERLSGDVEAQARSLGRAMGDKIVAFAKEQGWLEKPEVAEGGAEPKPKKLSQARPEKKPAKPAAQDRPAADPDKD